MKRKILLIASIFMGCILFTACKKCEDYPTYKLSDADKEWICYKEGQLLKFVSNLGNIKEYQVTLFTTTLETVNRPYSKTAWYPRICPKLKYELTSCVLTNTKNKYDQIFWYLYSTDSQNPGTEPYMYMSAIVFNLGLPVKYIIDNEQNFTDGTITPIIISVFVSKILIQNKEYLKVYKGNNVNSNWYYSKDFGLLKFDQNNES